MDVQTGLIYIGVAVVSVVVLGIVSMFAMKEKSYEEAIAEQRKLPDDLLLGKKEKGKEKKHKNKSGKKVKEKKEEKEEEKSEHVQFEENPQILPSEPVPVHENVKGNKKKGKAEKIKPILVNKDDPAVIVTSLSPQPVPSNNHFGVTQPKDDLELIRSHSKENLQHVSHSEPTVNKSPKDTPTKKKNVKDTNNKNKKDDHKEEKKENIPQPQKEVKEPTKETPKEVKETVTSVQQPLNKESKKSKKKIDILAQIGGEKDGVNVSLLMPLVQKAELSRSEIQILIDQLLNKQLDNPLEHSEWTEGRADPVMKLKKQLAEKEKAYADEREASVSFQSKLKELRTELNSEKSRYSSGMREMEESLNAKNTEVQTLQTRIQHILVSHAAEKQGFSGQIEQLQAKVKEDAAFIHKLQEDQGQSHGQMQQELLAQRKQLEAQFAQMRENENSLKGQLNQKHAEFQELQNAHMSVTEELQVTIETTSAEIDMLRQQIVMMQDQIMHSEGQLHHYKEAGDGLEALHRQLQAEVAEVQSELMTLESNIAVSKLEIKSKDAEIASLKSSLASKDEELKKAFAELERRQEETRTHQADKAKLEAEIAEVKNEHTMSTSDVSMLRHSLKVAKKDVAAGENQLFYVQEELRKAQYQCNVLKDKNDELESKAGEAQRLKKELKQMQDKNESMTTQLNERLESRENGIEEKIQKNNIQLVENSNLLAQKEDQLSALRTELTNKESQLSQLNAQVEALTSDVNKQSSLARRFEDDLNAQRSKNNELRTKNWKVMEALSAAENRARNNTGKSADDEVQKLKLEEQESTKALLERIFPEIKVSEKSHDQWVKAFEDRVCEALNDLKKDQAKDDTANPELEKENKSLQGLVSHYKKIIYDTESMLNELQSHIESEEIRWQAQLRQKENEVTNLRVEVTGLRNNTTVSDKLQQKITELEERLSEAQEAKKLNESPVRSKQSPDRSTDFAAVEQLNEEKSRLSQELLTESSKRATLDAEVAKLRVLVETSEANLAQEKETVSQLQQEVSQLKNKVCGDSISSEQSTLNGPPAATDPSQSEPMVGSQSLIAALEKTLLKNTELENCSIIETDDSVEVDTGSLTSKITSNTCHNTDNKIQANTNPLNGQQHKKHKKKRKGGSGKK